MRLNSHTMTVTRLSMKVKGKKGTREMLQNQDDVKRSVSSLDQLGGFDDGFGRANSAGMLSTTSNKRAMG